MATYVGLDWASKGWFGVVLRDDGSWETDLFPSMWSVWKRHSGASRILVDVPIGLPSESRRTCDERAKDRLGPRQASVFYAPVRDAVYRGNLDEAKELNETEAGFSIQNQAWSVVPRIREVDEFLDMNPSARDRLRETHPEVCFHALNGGTPLEHPKTTEAGIEQRRALLVEEYPETTAVYEAAVDRYTTPNYAPMVSGRDDILDALVAATTARRSDDESASLPRSEPTDDRGLPMQIVYPTDTRQARLSTLGSGD